MSELKTLDDFEDVPYEDVGPHSCRVRKTLKEELREEAKKWRSVLYDKIEESIKYVGKSDMNLMHCTDIIFYSAQINWIRVFFNLEDEDK